MKLFDKKYCEISYLKESNTLVQVWKKFCMPADFRKTQEKTVELFKEYNCKHLISDTTNAGILKKEEIEWVDEIITPQLAKAGMKEINFVVPNSLFTKMTLDNLKEQKKGGLPLNFYRDMTDALNHIKG